MNSRDLDNYITGHYGEDQFQDAPEIEDEGIAILNSAMNYLAGESKEAEGIMIELTRAIENDYCCKFCGHWIAKKNTYCGSNCAKADAANL